MVYTNTAAPVSGTPASSTTAWGTAVLVGGPYNSNTTWQNVTITLPAALAGTTKNLIFTWQNDGSFGSNPPAAIDDVSLISSPPPPAPSNDLCAGATPLPCGTTNLAGTTVNSTNVADPIGCASNYGVWYSFVGDGQSTTISSTATFDHEMVISSGSCGSLTNVVCDDGSSGSESHTFTATNGVTYFVYIAHWSTSSSTTGTFTISRSCTAPPVAPANDLCSGATNLPCGTTALAGTTVNSTNTAHGTACSMSNYGVWYTFVGNGQQTTISSTATFDHEMSISSGSCGSLSNITCEDDALSNGTESYTFTTTNGVTYYVYIAGWSSGSTTTGTFTISRTCSAPGSECAPNTVIASLPYVQTGFNTSGAGDDFDNADACASYYMNGDDYVFTYTPATDVCVNIALTNTSTWVGLFVTQGCPTTGTCVAYNTNSSGNPSVQDVYLTGGVEYFITVSTNPSPQTTPFDISVTTCPPPITACSGTFYDSGGPGGQYANNEYTKTTYCSGSTDCISFNFTSFNTESGWDYLDVYDGPSTSSPYIDSYSGTELNGVTLTSSGSCLTFVFDSDGSTSAAGWAATISCAACIILPVKLMSFTAKAKENYNVLDWQTATEVNNDYFVVESSTDMINFKEIGRVDGAGNSNNVLSYQYLDYTPFEKVIYYRLKQIDFDGVYTFSDIVAVKKTNEGEANIYPNPAKEVLFLEINTKEEAVYTIRYVNVLGATVQEKLVVAEGNNTYQLAEFKQLKSGIYFVQLINENDEVIKYQKIVKE